MIFIESSRKNDVGSSSAFESSSTCLSYDISNSSDCQVTTCSLFHLLASIAIKKIRAARLISLKVNLS
jgi:hypothetical protein